MKPIHRNNPSLRFLIDYWSKYCPLAHWHIDWAKRHIRVHGRLQRRYPLYLEGEKQKNVFFVTKGAIAWIDVDPDTGQRRILSIALPGMAMMTTHHLYSGTPSRGDIIVLHPHTAVIEIPYRPIKDFKEQEPHIDTLIDVLINKKNKQLASLRVATHGHIPYDNYVLFAELLPELHRILTHEERADLLGISLSTAKRCHKKWLHR